MCHGSEGDILAGRPEEPCLQDADAPLQGEGVDGAQLTQQACLGLISDLGCLQEPVQRSYRSMVPLLDLAAPEPFGPRPPRMLVQSEHFLPMRGVLSYPRGVLGGAVPRTCPF